MIAENSGTLEGHCHCGCGGKTKVAQSNDAKNGVSKGELRRYLTGHNLLLESFRSLYERIDTRYLAKDMGHETPCWVWQRAKSKSGYGQICWEGKTYYVHRLNYERYTGSLLEGQVVDHLCRVPSCVNPNHLEAVTQSENMLRGKYPPRHNLTQDQVDEIRRLYAQEGYLQKELAKMYNVSKSQMHRVVHGKYPI